MLISAFQAMQNYHSLENYKTLDVKKKKKNIQLNCAIFFWKNVMTLIFAEKKIEELNSQPDRQSNNLQNVTQKVFQMLTSQVSAVSHE